jgi:hypothetical protein
VSLFVNFKIFSLSCNKSCILDHFYQIIDISSWVYCFISPFPSCGWILRCSSRIYVIYGSLAITFGIGAALTFLSGMCISTRSRRWMRSHLQALLTSHSCMSFCIYVCMYVCSMYVVCLSVCMYVCMYVCLYVLCM